MEKIVKIAVVALLGFSWLHGMEKPKTKSTAESTWSLETSPLRKMLKEKGFDLSTPHADYIKAFNGYLKSNNTNQTRADVLNNLGYVLWGWGMSGRLFQPQEQPTLVEMQALLENIAQQGITDKSDSLNMWKAVLVNLAALKKHMKEKPEGPIELKKSVQVLEQMLQLLKTKLPNEKGEKLAASYTI